MTFHHARTTLTRSVEVDLFGSSKGAGIVRAVGIGTEVQFSLPRSQILSGGPPGFWRLQGAKSDTICVTLQ